MKSMKYKAAIALIILSLLGAAIAESNGFLKFYTENDWFALQAAEKTDVPEGLTQREAEIYRAGYANGHYDALHPAYQEGVYVLNTKTKKFHRSNCPNTLLISSENRQHSTLTAKELMAGELDHCVYQPCGLCHPET